MELQNWLLLPPLCLYGSFEYRVLSSIFDRTHYIQRVPAFRAFWELENNVIHEVHVSRNVVGPLLAQKSPTCKYISPKTVVVGTVLVIFV